MVGTKWAGTRARVVPEMKMKMKMKKAARPAALTHGWERARATIRWFRTSQSGLLAPRKCSDWWISAQGSGSLEHYIAVSSYSPLEALAWYEWWSLAAGSTWRCLTCPAESLRMMIRMRMRMRMKIKIKRAMAMAMVEMEVEVELMQPAAMVRM